MKTAQIKIKLKSDTGLNSETNATITVDKWRDINMVIEGKLSSEKWISVEDKLPEIDKEDFYSIDFLVKGEIHVHGELSHIGTTIGWMSRAGEWNNIIPDKQKCYVTHYMPIPE